jgi:hypothetical protein
MEQPRSQKLHHRGKKLVAKIISGANPFKQYDADIKPLTFIQIFACIAFLTVLIGYASYQLYEWKHQTPTILTSTLPTYPPTKGTNI